MSENVDSASVPLDDIETIKRRQSENWDALQEAKEALIRTNIRLDRSDEGQLEILRRQDEQRKALDANNEATARIEERVQFIVDLGETLQDAAAILVKISGWISRAVQWLARAVKPLTAIILFCIAVWQGFKAYVGK
ncbi:MAG: hypothetical protein JWQ89_2521 [Devosia sp.]|uniref:hypothetical protein n=1 Tax=Devosia sp. TaxID=1871048 RepID=UPI00261D6322|nr:hypothetical protein [Devosia sp.]MDB5540794.1 hypothetical protein [Devosia sp.]